MKKQKATITSTSEKTSEKNEILKNEGNKRFDLEEHRKKRFLQKRDEL
jgi:hypothetical protein